MERLRYLDFELKIERKGEQYTARVLSSPAGEASSIFTLPFSEERLELLVLKIGRLRSSTRRIQSSEMEAARELGGKLFEAIFSDEVRVCIRSSLDEIHRQEGTGLRLKLRLQEVAELADLPWEFLFDSSLDRFIAQSNQTPIVRYVEMPERITALTVNLPLRVLVMISSPSDYARLDVERERSMLQEALEPLSKNGKVRVEWLDKATLAALQHCLRDGEYHVFHFIGHGGFDKKAEEGVLVLEDEQERGWLAGAHRIGTLLHDHRSLRLAVLNSCEGARNSRTDPFAGVATTLIRQGVPAVVAMQFEITDEAAITFAHEFYTALAEGFPVDAAVAEARKAIYAQPNDVEWGTPVLYMRSPDGVLFSIQEQKAEDKTQEETKLEQERREREAREKAAREEAKRKANEEHQQQEQIATLYKQARGLVFSCQWQQALEKMREIQALDFQFADPERIAAKAQEELEREAERKTHEKAAKEEAERKAHEEELKRKPGKSKVRYTSPWVFGAVGGLIVLALLIVGLWKWNKSQQQEQKEAEQTFNKGEEYYNSGNYYSALPLFQQAAKAGDMNAVNYLGYMYRNGLGVEQNYTEAVRWFRKTAEAEDALGMTNLGHMYQDGLGVGQNYKEAARLYTKGAEAGNALAMSSLGYMYANGLGVEKNYDEAVQWYKKAAFLGDEYAKSALKSQILYEDNFETLDPAWGQPGPNLSIKDGKLIIQPEVNKGFPIINRAKPFEDIDASIEVSLTKSDDPSYGAGLIFWAKDYSNYYFLYVNGNGQFSVQHWVNNRNLIPVEWRENAAIKKGIGEWNQLRVVTKENKATVYINGTEVVTFKGEPPQGDSFIGMRGDSPEKSQNIWELSNLKVTKPYG